MNRALDQAKIWKFNECWSSVRLIGSMCSVYEFWIPILTASGCDTSIPKLCLDWDSNAHAMISEICPYRKAGLKGRRVYYSNAIIRDLQASKKKHDRLASPVRVVKIPPSLYKQLENLKAINRRIAKSGKEKMYSVAHPKFGRDVQIKTNPAMPYSYYDVQIGQRLKLTNDELQYPLFFLDEIKPETPARAEAEWKKLSRIYVGG